MTKKSRIIKMAQCPTNQKKENEDNVDAMTTEGLHIHITPSKLKKMRGAEQVSIVTPQQ